MLATPPPRPLYLGTAPDPLFGFFHSAAPGSERETAVLLCPPFGWDDVASYRTRLIWSELLALAGHATLRIDLPGAGDSAGSPHDPDRVEAWTGAVAGAAAWLKSQTACTRVAAIGIGIGGFAAYLAAAGGAPLDELVLWGVPARGKTLMRELRAFASLKAAEFPDPDAVEPPPLPEGLIEVAGYVMSAETAEAIAAIDLTTLALPSRRVLLLGRDSASPDSRLRDHLESAGLDVTAAAGPGYGDALANPQEPHLPVEVFDMVAAWLAAPATGALPAATAPEARDTLELHAHGALVRETPVEVAQPFGRLFGILSEPARPPAADVALVLVNGGAVRRIGPNRMWVEVARRWAARGVPVLRLDIEGLGDSDGDWERYADTKELYSADLAHQVEAAIDTLEQRGTATRFVVAGLCAGAFWAFHALREDDRVVGACMINLWAFFWDDARPAATEARRARKLARPSTWMRILRGEGSFGQLWTALKYLARTPFERGERRRRARQLARRLDESFDAIRDADKRAILVFGRGEPVHDEFERDGRLERMERWPNMEIHTIPTRDHTFRALWQQEQLHAVIDHTMQAEIERAPRAAAPHAIQPAAG